MACVFAGISGADCKEGVGGIVEVAIGNFSDFASGVVVDSTTEVITALPLATIYRVGVRRAQGGYSEAVSNDTNLFFTQTVTLNVFGLTPATRKQIMNLAKGKVVVFVRTKSSTKANQWVMCGRGGGMELTGTFGSGTAAGDINGYQVTLTAEEEAAAEHLAAYTTDPFDNFTDITVSPAY